jgi:hypothetical protein
MTPPDEPDLGDELCNVTGCMSFVVLDHEMCDEHLKEQAEEDRAERVIDMAQDDGREYPKGYDGTGSW